MKCFVGIDLGSTTTKAVVLDEEQRVVGRGITNSRSNYDIACAVARSEAFDNVRFSRCEAALPEAGLDPEETKRFLDLLGESFRLSKYVAQLRVLRDEMIAEIPSVEPFFPGASLEAPIRQALAEMHDAAPALFAPGAPRRSDFFRDMASSQYHRLAEKLADPVKLPFEALLAVFDKAILKVENRRFTLSFEEGTAPAIDRTIVEAGLEGTTAADRIRGRLKEAFSIPIEVSAEVGTGYGRARLPFSKEQIRSEILCHGLGAHRMFPKTATVLDIGGQDTKAIQVDDAGIVTSFQMNDRCAAGCGRYLGYIADEMNLGLHELGPLAEQAKRPVKINSTCTVFAGAEIRDRLTLGQAREDILAGLHRAVILRAMSLIARSGGIKNEFTFTGGVANNVTAVRVLKQLVHDNYGDVTINVSPSSIYTGALGAAIFAYRGAKSAAREAFEV